LDEGAAGRIGLYLEPGFLEPGLRLKLFEEMTSAEAEAATIRHRGDVYRVDEDRRRTRRARVGEATVALVEQRLASIADRIGSAFGIASLAGIRELQFLIYRQGDYFKRHVDRIPDRDQGHPSQARQVSVVLFINGPAAEPAPGSYGGGALRFYLADGEAESAHDLDGEPGLLVAFPPTAPHEVTPVSHGERFTIVGWFV
jgi:SM-20-related protein